MKPPKTFKSCVQKKDIMHKMNTPQKFDSERQLRTSCPLWQAAAEEEADQQMVSAKQALLGGGATRNLFSYENDFYKYYIFLYPKHYTT